jgi:hypothetical protein
VAGSDKERSMPNKPRSFKEVVAAQDPAERARLANRESFDDVTVANPFHREVSVIEDRDGTGECLEHERSAPLTP